MLAGSLLRAYFSLFGRLVIKGREHLPAEGCVLVSNHTGWADPLWIGFAAWPRTISPMAKQELFDVPVLSRVLHNLGAFPVKRGVPGPSSIKIPVDILNDRGIILIFPGGRREAQVSGVKRGAATIAQLAGVPVVPVRFLGPATLNLRHALWRRPEVLVEFAAPIPQPQGGVLTSSERKEQIARMVDEIERRLLALTQTDGRNHQATDSQWRA